MSWVSVDQDKCNSCGLCVTRCVRCFADNDGAITAEANVDNCNLCGHCVALCPTSAIEHHQMDMAGFVEYTRTASIDTQTFIQFLRERRSHRHFKDKPVSKKTLETLMEFAANGYPALAQALDLPPGHQVYSIIILGYPKLKFLRAVDRKSMTVRWE